MNNFITRSITGVVLVAMLVASIVIHPLFFGTVVFVILIFSLIELYNLLVKAKYHPQLFFGLFAAAMIYLINFAIANKLLEYKHLILLIVPLLLPFISELFRKSETPFVNVALTLLGLVFVALPFTLLLYFYRFDIENHHLNYIYLLGFFVFIWTNDSMAYVVGMLIGKTPFFSRISPKKTWEGTIGGLVFTSIAAYVFALISDQSIWIWIGYAYFVVIPAIFGDLVESLLKRSLNVKDSGSLLPGHGGFLDRFDSVFMASPFAFVYLKLILQI